MRLSAFRRKMGRVVWWDCLHSDERWGELYDETVHSDERWGELYDETVCTQTKDEKTGRRLSAHSRKIRHGRRGAAMWDHCHCRQSRLAGWPRCVAFRTTLPQDVSSGTDAPISTVEEGLERRAGCGGVGVSVPGGAVSWTPLVTAADVLNGDSDGQVSVCWMETARGRSRCAEWRQRGAGLGVLNGDREGQVSVCWMERRTGDSEGQVPVCWMETARGRSRCAEWRQRGAGPGVLNGDSEGQVPVCWMETARGRSRCAEWRQRGAGLGVLNGDREGQVSVCWMERRTGDSEGQVPVCWMETARGRSRCAEWRQRGAGPGVLNGDSEGQVPVCWMETARGSSRCAEWRQRGAVPGVLNGDREGQVSVCWMETERAGLGVLNGAQDRRQRGAGLGVLNGDSEGQFPVCWMETERGRSRCAEWRQRGAGPGVLNGDREGQVSVCWMETGRGRSRCAEWRQRGAVPGVLNGDRDGQVSVCWMEHRTGDSEGQVSVCGGRAGNVLCRPRGPPSSGHPHWTAANAHDEVMLNVLRCQLTYEGQAVTNAEAWFSIALRPRKPEGSFGQDGHLDSHTAPELSNAHVTRRAF